MEDKLTAPLMSDPRYSLAHLVRYFRIIPETSSVVKLSSLENNKMSGPCSVGYRVLLAAHSHLFVGVNRIGTGPLRNLN